LHGANRDRECRLERLGCGGGDRLRGRFRERPADQLDRLARDVAETGSQAPRLQRRCRRPQCVEIFFRHPHHCRHLSSTFSIALIRNGSVPTGSRTPLWIGSLLGWPSCGVATEGGVEVGTALWSNAPAVAPRRLALRLSVDIGPSVLLLIPRTLFAGLGRMR